MRLLDKVVIVTGSTHGIGRVIALHLAKEGADVVVHGRDAARAKEVSEQIKAMGRQSVVMIADATNSREVNDQIKIVLEKLGQIDILVNNVGGSARDKATFFHESTEDVWDSVIARNLKSAMIFSRAVINYMMQRHTGNIINISSPAGAIGESKMVDYSAAKAGVVGFTKALAKEAGPFGIRVNCVCPAGIKNPEGVEHMPHMLEQFLQRSLLGRAGEAEDVAQLITFLASDEASFITGQHVIVSGGETIV